MCNQRTTNPKIRTTNKSMLWNQLSCQFFDQVQSTRIPLLAFPIQQSMNQLLNEHDVNSKRHHHENHSMKQHRLVHVRRKQKSNHRSVHRKQCGDHINRTLTSDHHCLIECDFCTHSLAHDDISACGLIKLFPWTKQKILDAVVSTTKTFKIEWFLTVLHSEKYRNENSVNKIIERELLLDAIDRLNETNV